MWKERQKAISKVKSIIWFIKLNHELFHDDTKKLIENMRFDTKGYAEKNINSKP